MVFQLISFKNKFICLIISQSVFTDHRRFRLSHRHRPSTARRRIFCVVPPLRRHASGASRTDAGLRKGHLVDFSVTILPFDRNAGSHRHKRRHFQRRHEPARKLRLADQKRRWIVASRHHRCSLLSTGQVVRPGQDRQPSRSSRGTRLRLRALRHHEQQHDGLEQSPVFASLSSFRHAKQSQYSGRPHVHELWPFDDFSFVVVVKQPRRHLRRLGRIVIYNAFGTSCRINTDGLRQG